jgi:hypothetical protein
VESETPQLLIYRLLLTRCDRRGHTVAYELLSSMSSQRLESEKCVVKLLTLRNRV